MKQLLCFSLLFINCNIGYGQYSTTGFDSIILQSIDGDTLHLKYSKAQRMETLWNSTREVVENGGSATYYDYKQKQEQGILFFSSKNAGWPDVQISKEKRETVYVEQFTAGGNIGRGLLVAFLPGFVSVAGEKEIAWQYNASMQSNSGKTNLYCYLKGQAVKETRMMKNSQGMNLPQTTTTAYLQYERGAAGYVLNGKDTISEWYASAIPKTDSGMFEQANYILRERPDKLKHKVGLFVYNQSVYGLKGYWNNNPFSIIFNDMDNKAWIFWDNHLTAVYQYPGLPVRRVTNLMKIPDEQDPFSTFILVNPSVNSDEARQILFQQIALAAWMVDVMSRPA